MDWNGQRVLVTGSRGFIARHLVRRLANMRAVVFGYDLEDGQDLTDPLRVRLAVESMQPDYIFHLGANSMVAASQGDPLGTFQVNVAGTWNVMDAARRVGGVKGMVSSSSNHVYGEQVDYPSDEDAPLNHTSVYSTTKIMVDHLSRCYAKEFGLPSVTIRHTNIYGPDDAHETHIVTGSIISILKGDRPVIRSQGLTKKGYLYVDDVVDAYLLLAEKAKAWAGQPFNCTSDCSYSALDIARTLRYVMHSDLQPVVLGETPGEPDEYLDASLLRHLGWEQKMSLEEGLRRTVESMKVPA